MRHVSKTLIVASVTTLLGVATPATASAEGMYVEPYIAASAGSFRLATGGSSTTVTGGFVALGAEVNPYFCPELRFGGAGKGATSGYSRVSLDWFASWLIRVQVPVNEDALLYGVGGATTMRTALTTTAGLKNSHTSTIATYGIGLEYRPAEHLSVGAEWVRYGRGYKRASNSGLDVTGISGLLKYSF